MREGEKKENSFFAFGDFFFSFNFLMWGLRKLNSIIPKVPLHS